MTAILEAVGVSKSFTTGFLRKNRFHAVEDISLRINADDASVTAIAGESGSGKTTLARLLLKMIQPTEGTVLYRGHNLRVITNREQKSYRREVQAVFQDPFEVYNPFYKVDAVLHGPAEKFRLAETRAKRQKLIDQALEMAGLRPEETLGRYPHQLSGGQRQRVMVARAILLRPKVLIADEPVSMVDASLRATILETLLKLNREFGAALIYITHDLTTAFQISDNIYILYKGSVVEAGDTDKAINDPRHPYTQLLVRSIPRPDPKAKWGPPERASALGLRASSGCKFAPRCPMAMQRCWDTMPPLFQGDVDRVAACYLEDKHPHVMAKDMSSMLG